jgi:3-hydroxyisobutyrate dehydrogenase-like beta-hydroxyacid dehydrogenase
MRIAVLGLGRMGQALAGRLLAEGQEVTVWNRSPGKATGLVGRGATEASSAAGATSGAEVIMTLLAADDAVIEVLVPSGRPLPVAADAIVVECSTVSPATTRSLAVAYHDRLVASPVLGGPAALEAGEATFAVAGPPDLIGALGPLWAALGGAVRRCGDDPGLALVVKLVNNYLLMGGLAILSEAVVAAQRAGLDDAFLIDLLPTLPLVAPGLRNRIADLVAGDHDGWFPTPMGAKDVRLLLELMAGHSTVLPVAELVGARYAEAASTGLGEGDLTAVIELLRRDR